MIYYLGHVLVAQLDRALDSDSKGQRFESSRARHPAHNEFRANSKKFIMCWFLFLIKQVISDTVLLTRYKITNKLDANIPAVVLCYH